MENNEKITLPDALHFLGLILQGFLCFLGAYNLLEGSMLFAGGSALLLTIISWFSIYVIIKSKKSYDSSAVKRLREGIFSGILVIIILLSGFLIIHAENIEFYAKNDIQMQLAQEIDEFDKIVDTYSNYVKDKKNAYEGNIRTRDLQNGIPNDKAVENAKKEAEDFEKRITTGTLDSLNGLKEKNKVYIASNKKIIEEWDRFNIPLLLNTLPIQKKELINELTKLSKNHPFTDTTSFQYEVTSYTNINLSNPTSLLDKTNVFFAIISLLTINILVLLPIIIIRRKQIGTGRVITGD